MKVLQLTHKPPVPCIDGGCLAMCQITTSLLDTGINVKVVSIATPKHPVVHAENTATYFNKTRFESVFVDTGVTLRKAICSLLKRTSLQTDRFFSKEMAQKLKEIFSKEAFDVVILESIFVGNYMETIKKYSQARIILRVHNIEHLIWKRLAQQTKNPFKKTAYYYLSHSLKRFEFSLFKKIDGYMPITEVEYLYFKEKYPTLRSQTIPFAINLSDYQMRNHQIDEKNITFFHIGSMNWQPNIEGITWFLENVWKKVVEKYPQIHLVLAGKGTKTVFDDTNYKNVQIFDYVENAQQFMNEHDIMIVPLLSGSGMRIKIVEGLALGKPIITTAIGAEGIEITDKENIFIANTPEEMIKTITFCATHIKKCEKTGKNARDLIEDKYNQKNIAQKLVSLFSEFVFA